MRTILNTMKRGALPVVFAAFASGCAGAGRPGFVRDYEAGRHAAAYRQASATATESSGRSREEAALIAGLSAHALGDAAAAAEWLSPLRGSADRSVSGRALAGLGLIAAERKEHERAAAMLSEASIKLTGDDAARAAFHAGESLGALDRRGAAEREYRRAHMLTRDARLKSILEDRLNGMMYTIQLGAFSSRRNADLARRDAAATAAGLGFGSPRIVVTTRDGRTLYLVQVGQFRSEHEATEARRRLGADAIVAVAGFE